MLLLDSHPEAFIQERLNLALFAVAMLNPQLDSAATPNAPEACATPGIAPEVCPGSA